MKTIKLAFLATFVVAFAFAGRAEAQSNLQIADSKMWIEGTSSVHDFTCNVNSMTGSVNVNGDVTKVADATVVVPVSQIDCDNKTMNSKVRDALNAGKNPGISFNMVSATPNGANGEWQNLDVKGELELNGTKRPVAMKVQGQKNANGAIVYRGQVPVVMTHYGVKPPTAMLGALKTGDEVQVHFELTLRG